MFQEYYGFSSLPFSKTIATKDLFVTAAQQELGARLTYLVRERGLGLLTGEIGSGKSTAVRAFTAGLDFNRFLVQALGQQPPFSRPRMVAGIRAAFSELLSTKRRAPLLIIDEAHLLSQPMLEQLRLLCSDQMDSQTLATLLLVGHPELRRTLQLTVHEAFNQRLSVRYHLGPLDLAETIAYVRHHIRVAGYLSGPLFTDDALGRIFEYTKGLPRRINQVCTTALMAGVIDKHSVLDESIVRKAIADLDHE
jgi:general secretion pathway protein A